MWRNKIVGWVIVISVLALLLLAVAQPAAAFDSRTGRDVVIEAGETVNDDLFVASDTLTVKGTVKGDVIAVGSEVNIESSGVVQGDLIAAAQSVIVEGKVTDDVRIAGAVLIVGRGATIGDDLIAAGFSLEVEPGSAIGGSLVFGGAQLLMSGDVDESAKIASGAVRIVGSVGGDMTAYIGEVRSDTPFSRYSYFPNAPRVPEVRPGLTIDQDAKIAGDLEYTSSVETDIPKDAIGGKVTWNQPVVEEKRAEEFGRVLRPLPRLFFISTWLLDQAQKFMSLLILGLLVAWLVPGAARRAVAVLQTKPWHSLGWGFLSFFGFIFALLVVVAATGLVAFFLGVLTFGDLVGTIITIGGLILTAVVLVFGVSVVYLSKLVVGYLVGRWLLGLIRPAWAENRFWPMLLGVVIYVILTAIPIFGSVLLNAVVILFGLGALVILGYEVTKVRFARQAA
jgi:cytoskeletal protein CcmA (bactofilin family)